MPMEYKSIKRQLVTSGKNELRKFKQILSKLCSEITEVEY